MLQWEFTEWWHAAESTLSGGLEQEDRCRHVYYTYVLIIVGLAAPGTVQVVG